jgi:hypothetical protein
VDEGQWERSHTPDATLQRAKWGLLGDPIRSMKGSSLGTGLLEMWLEGVRTAVEKDGELTDAAISNVVQVFGGKPNSLTRELAAFHLKLQANPDGLDAVAFRKEQKAQALSFLDQKLSALGRQRAECEEREESAEQARQAAALLPSADVLERILRYETKLERQLYRAMTQLERLQRMRRGESVLAPLSVEVSERL